MSADRSEQVGVRKACLAAVAFAEDEYSTASALHLPRIVGDRPAWAEGDDEEEQRQQEAEAEAQQLRQDLEERIEAEVEVRFNEWMVEERAENLYLDTIPQERQQREKAQIRQQVSQQLRQRSCAGGGSAVVPEAVAKVAVADFAVAVLGLRVRMERSAAGPIGQQQVSHLVLEKPSGYASYSSRQRRHRVA